MKTTLLLLSICPLLSLTTHAVEAPTQTVMQAKLRHAQSLLASVTTADFAAMEKSAAHLTELGNLTSWYSSQTPTDQLLLEVFRRSTESVAKAAREKNLDAAALAYVQLTLSCVGCHKHNRENKSATLPMSGIGKLAQVP